MSHELNTNAFVMASQLDALVTMFEVDAPGTKDLARKMLEVCRSHPTYQFIRDEEGLDIPSDMDAGAHRIRIFADKVFAFARRTAAEYGLQQLVIFQTMLERMESKEPPRLKDTP